MKKHNISPIAYLFLFLLFSATAQAQIRVMPLGDAVVLGTGSSTSDVGGFRDDLSLFLSTKLIPFDFVGSLDDGVTADPHHEGHSGTTVDAINQNLSTYLQQHNPHIVLIHIGTEELRDNANVNNVLGSLSTTIDLISGYSSETEILLASLIPSRNSALNQNINLLNPQLQALVQTKAASGVSINYVDINTTFQLNPNWQNDYMSSDFFPNDTGYGILAQVFFSNINSTSKYIDLVTFFDNFNNRFLLGPNWNTHPSFRITNNELENSSSNAVWDKHLAIVNSLPNANSLAFKYSSNADETGVLETGAVILLDKASTSANGYLITINSGLLRLWSLTDGNIDQNLKNVTVTQSMPQPGDDFAMTWQFINQTLQVNVFINNNPFPVLEHDMTPPGENEVRYSGIMLRGDRNNNIDDFFLTNFVDETPPAQITDLSLVWISASAAKLRFTTTGDDSLTDTAQSFDVRYSTSPITDVNFAQAIQATILKDPDTPGTIEEIAVSGLSKNVQYFFALQIIDDSRNASKVSNVVSGTTLDALYFSEQWSRSEIGDQWHASSDIEINNATLTTTNSSAGWNSLAILKAPTSAFELGFQWVNATSIDDINDVGILINLDDSTSTANGVMISRNTTNRDFQLWNVEQGSPTQLIDSFVDGLPNPVTGSILKVYVYSESTSTFFAVFVNDIYYGTLTQANGLSKSNTGFYSGVIFQGNSTIGIDNFFTYSPFAVAADLSILSGDGQTGPLSQVLEQPLEVKVTDDGGQPVYFSKVEFEVASGDAIILPPSQPDGFTFIEAEEGILTPPMMVVEDPLASGEKYIETPADSGENGMARYHFHVPVDGVYSFWGRVIAPSGTEDSFFITVDDNEEITWDVLQFNHQTNWTWDQVSARGEGGATIDPWTLPLTKGIHSLTVRRRDPGTKLDRMIITKDPLFVPFDLGGEAFYASDFSGIAKAFVQMGTTAGEVSVSAKISTLPGSEVFFTLQAIPNPPFQISEFSGNNQVGTAGFALPQPFVVLVQDEFGNPVADTEVTFEIVLGNGSFQGPATILTNAAGQASVTLVLAIDGEENRVVAMSDGLVGSPITFDATATSGLATKLEYFSGNNQTAEVGSQLPAPLEVLVLDNEDNRIPGFPVFFDIVSDMGGTLSADTSISDANGVARTNFTFGTKIGEYSIQARSDGLENSPILFAATATAASAHELVEVSGDSASGVSSLPLTTPFVVKVVDQYGNAVANEDVIFRVKEGGGLFVGGQVEVTKTTDADGLASAILILGNVVGGFSNKVEVIKDGLIGSPIEFVAEALAPTAFKLELVDGNNQIGIINQPLDLPFRVRVLNPIDEPMKNHPVTFRVKSGNGVFVATIDTIHITATDESGIASTVFRIGTDVGENVNVVEASGSRGSLPLVGSPVIFNASGKYDADKIQVVRGNNQSGLINSTLFEPLEIIVRNSANQAVSGIPVEFRVGSGGGTLDSSQDTLVVKNTNISGKASVMFNLGNESGLNNNTVTVTATNGFQALQGSPIIFSATAANSPAVALENLSQSPLTGIVGNIMSDPIRIRVKDNSNLPVANHEVEFRVLSGNGKIIGSDPDTVLIKQTNEDGIIEIQWQLGIIAGTSNNQLRIISDNGIAPLTNSPMILTAIAVHSETDPDSSFITSTSPVIANGQDKATVTVTLRDKYNNPIPGKTVELTVVGQLSFIEQPGSATDVNGHTVGYLTSIQSGQKIIHARNVTDNINLNTTSTVEFISNEASRIKLDSGNAQTRNIGTVLAEPLVVSITDVFDNPIPNYPVTFSAKTQGGEFIEDQPVYTDSTGLAIVNYVLSETEGINIIEATANNLEGSPILFSATGVRSTASKMIPVSGNSQTGMVSDTLEHLIVVQVLDENDNPLKGVPVDFKFTAGNGRFIGSQPVFTDVYGRAGAQPILGPELITQVMFVTSTKLPGTILTFFANTLPAGATNISIHSGEGQSLRPLEQSRQLQVLTRDSFNNLVPGAEVIFEIIEGEAIIITDQPVVSNSLGLSSVVIQARTTPGTVKISASLVANPAQKVIFVVLVLPAAPHNLILVSGDQQIGTRNYFLSEPLVAKVTDVFDNPIPNESVSFIISSGDATVVGNSVKLTDSEGIAKCQLKIGENANQIEVLALVGQLPGVILTYHITAVDNEIPLLVSEAEDRQVQENEHVSFNISIIDPDGDPVTVELADPPTGAVVTKVNAVSWRFDWTPNFEQSGEYDIVYSVLDNRGGIVSDTVHVKVTDVNRFPLITHFQPTRDSTLIQGNQIEFSVEVVDPDQDTLIVYWKLNNQIVSDSASFIYESDNNFTGEEIVEVFVTDSKDTITYKWTITVITSVNLVQFNAQVDVASSAVLLQWTTNYESGNAGFDILRSTQRDIGYRKINSILIPANTGGTYEYLDKNVTAGFRYFYKVLDKNIHGVTSEHGPIQVWFELPSDFQLEQNYPNPLAIDIGQTSTVIQFRIPSKEEISIHIFNALGQQVRTLTDESYEPGIYQVTWDGMDNSGKLVPSGVYFYKLSAGSHRQIKRMILIR